MQHRPLPTTYKLRLLTTTAALMSHCPQMGPAGLRPGLLLSLCARNAKVPGLAFSLVFGGEAIGSSFNTFTFLAFPEF